MSYLKFGHVFFGLMTLAFVSAFIFSPRITQKPKAQVQNIFAPVAWPMNRMGGWVRDRLETKTVRDDGSPKHPRGADEVYRENQALHVEVTNLIGQLDYLKQREGEMVKMGEAGAFCTQFSVVGTDSGQIDSLMLNGSSFSNIAAGEPVIYAGGLVGRISRAGVGGAQVLLISDPQSKKLEAKFVTKAGVYQEPCLVEGIGKDRLRATIPQSQRSASGVDVDDLVVLADSDWPLLLTNYRIGRVVSIKPNRDPGFYDVLIAPESDLRELREVMVMNKEKG